MPPGEFLNTSGGRKIPSGRLENSRNSIVFESEFIFRLPSRKRQDDKMTYDALTSLDGWMDLR
ncbi:MAG: hypothetical protein Tsb009_36680 [Planctomycetaceae bacterium]